MDIIIIFIVVPILLLPQIAAGVLARQLGRKFWFWFWISFILPMISMIILLCLEDKSEAKTGVRGVSH